MSMPGAKASSRRCSAAATSPPVPRPSRPAPMRRGAEAVALMAAPDALPDMTPPPLGAEHALFLDFDGTLVAIAPTPSSIVVPPELPGLLNAASEKLGGALAIVSGRPVHPLAKFLDGYAGIIT